MTRNPFDSDAQVFFPYREGTNFQLFEGDCLEVLRSLPVASFDSLVTDPPAGISFMGKGWDSNKGGRHAWVKWMTEVMTAAYRALKPGAHGLVWAIPRTSHWMAWALEDAGFEIRDVIVHLFGSGFPKSMDVSKAIDKAAGAEREVVGKAEHSQPAKSGHHGGLTAKSEERFTPDVTVATTDAAKKWQGWGTALKPASEHWILIRKPFPSTVEKNVLRHGTGGINIDGCRIGTEERFNRPGSTKPRRAMDNHWREDFTGSSVSGRFPANLVLDEEAAEMLDKQSGTTKSASHSRGNGIGKGTFKSTKDDHVGVRGVSDFGGASRFFYVAKASKSDRGGKENKHPTVKSTALMSYLVKLVTPPGGTVLDPFTGSGTTGVSSLRGGWKFVGIEQDGESVDTTFRRLRKVPQRG